MSCVYLLHFSRAIGKPQSSAQREGNGLEPREGDYHAHAQHYIGFTTNLEKRLATHRAGWGGHLCRVAVKRGIEIELARVWEGASRGWEARLKRHKNAPRLCPICSGEIAYERMAGPDAEG